MKKKNESLLLFFSSPEFHARFNPKSSRNYYILAYKYRKFCVKHGYERNNEGFAKYYDLAKIMHGKQYDLRQQRIESLNIKSSKDIKGDTIRGKSMWHKDSITGLDRRLLQMEGELARCQAKIKALELKLKKEQEKKKGRSFPYPADTVKIYACSHDFEEFRCMIPIDNPYFRHCAFDSYRNFCEDIHEIPVNFREFCRRMWPQEEKEQPIGKISDYKASVPYIGDKLYAMAWNYFSWCKKNNLKPVTFHEFKKQMWGDVWGDK